MADINTELAILMPKISPENYERFSIRYGGLVDELLRRNVSVSWIDGHASIDAVAETAELACLSLTPDGRTEWVTPEQLLLPAVIRDLTMPKNDVMPVYGLDKKIINDPRLNSFLKYKSNMHRALPSDHPFTIALPDSTHLGEAIAEVPGEKVVVKPVTGQESKGVLIGDKRQVFKAFICGDRPSGALLVQEFIDTSGGIQELGVEGTHNIRVLSIGGLAIFATARVVYEGDILIDDIYARFYRPDELPETMLRLVDGVHGVLGGIQNGHDSVIAIDLMRGLRHDGEQVDTIVEVNRRPLRISRYDMYDVQPDQRGLLWAANQWDRAEAELLATAVEAAKTN